jgi:hypothetical protein
MDEHASLVRRLPGLPAPTTGRYYEPALTRVAA